MKIERESFPYDSLHFLSQINSLSAKFFLFLPFLITVLLSIFKSLIFVAILFGYLRSRLKKVVISSEQSAARIPEVILVFGWSGDRPSEK